MQRTPWLDVDRPVFSGSAPDQDRVLDVHCKGSALWTGPLANEPWLLSSEQLSIYILWVITQSRESPCKLCLRLTLLQSLIRCLSDKLQRNTIIIFITQKRRTHLNIQAQAWPTLGFLLKQHDGKQTRAQSKRDWKVIGIFFKPGLSDINTALSLSTSLEPQASALHSLAYCWIWCEIDQFCQALNPLQVSPYLKSVFIYFFKALIRLKSAWTQRTSASQSRRRQRK